MDIVLEKMQGAMIRGHKVLIQIDEAPKRKRSQSMRQGKHHGGRKESSKDARKPAPRERRRGAGRHERSVRKSKAKK